jgi:NitT/TauT family transport system substrate-binding protein
MKKTPLLRSLVLSLAMLVSLPTFAAVKKEFNVCWTIYAGWMPWGTISSSKIIDKWASKYGIKINVVQLNDYIESINQYTAGQFDGCTMTNMDALTIPAAGGVDTTALILGSYSEGNDGVVMKGGQNPQGPERDEGLPAGAVRFPLPAGARPGKSRAGRERRHRGEYL